MFKSSLKILLLYRAIVKMSDYINSINKDNGNYFFKFVALEWAKYSLLLMRHTYQLNLPFPNVIYPG